MEKMRRTLLKAYLECKREALTNWYADYRRKQEEGQKLLESLNGQKQQLKQQFHSGEISRMFYRHQNEPLNKRVSELEQTLKNMANEELSALLPGVFNRPDDTELVTFDEVVEFLEKREGQNG